MKRKKTKVQKIQEAVDSLNRALEMEEPNIRISLPGGFYDNKESEEFMEAVATFSKVYKKFYRLERVKIEFTL
jgi:hypothetical protein